MIIVCVIMLIIECKHIAKMLGELTCEVFKNLIKPAIRDKMIII